MARKRLKQLALVACAIGAIAASAYASQRVWRENGLKALQAVSEQRLQLVANAIKAEISRQDHLPVVLSLDPDVREALMAVRGAPRGAYRFDNLNRKLARLSQEADTRAMFVIGPDGTVIASDDWELPDSLIGRTLADRPYFVQAVQSGRSSYLGIEPSTNRVRYYLAEAIRDEALLGVAVVRIEFDSLESAWERAGEHVVVSDADGVAFLASEAVYRYRGLGLLGSPTRRERNPAERYYGVSVADIDGQIIERRLSTLIVILALYVVERHRAYVAASKSGAELKRQVAERTYELSESNASLQTEIEERRRTEVRLRETQNELVQAGKLAALGQMSAAIAHEINQPLAAIRTFVASTRIFAQRRDLVQVVRNLDLITDLAERMASITGHLKTFARKSEPDDPYIRLTVRASGDSVSIVVADNGHGIPANQIDRMFDPFFTTKPVGKGLGLGLSISYGIVQDFGGRIQATNRAEGGAELTVTLPRHVRQPLEVESAIHG